MLQHHDDIPKLDDHDDAAALRDYDHPTECLRRWDGVLTAKAWVGSDLACFFTDAEAKGMRIVLVFKSSQGFRPRFDGLDMRESVVGRIYEMDVFVAPSCLPIIDRVEAV